MAYLALDTSSQTLSLALLGKEGICSRQWSLGTQHSECVLPYLHDFLTSAQMTRHDLEGIAYGMGPGSFTGLRIACSIAQGLAVGLNIPLFGISTLHALAHASAAKRVLVCLDARMGEVYYAAFTRNASGECEETCPACVGLPESLTLPNGEGWVGVGSGFEMYETRLTAYFGPKLSAVLPGYVPRAEHILTLALPVFKRQEAWSPLQAKILYLRHRIASPSQVVLSRGSNCA